jgi:hypoxanthine phosphoribosyltransferase
MNFSKIVDALQDTFSDKTRTRVSEDQVGTSCVDLAGVVRRTYHPDLVIAIDMGGSMPGELTAEALGIPVRHITVGRDIRIGRMYNKDPLPLRCLMSTYHHYLFHTVKPKVIEALHIDISSKKILIVDDSVHTGASLIVAKEYLKQNFVSEVKVATLTHVSKIKPDFSILPAGNYCFPWSKDYMKEEVG